MDYSTLACPKCKSAMEEGFISDHTQHSSITVSEWIEGAPPDQGWWGFWWGLKTGDKEKLRVMTFRCVRCGYLESYAPVSTK